jgi:uncharacterized protein (TIGR02217 family)
MGLMTTPFPDFIAAGATGGHGHFATTIVQMFGGHESPNKDDVDGRGAWNVSQTVKRLDADGALVVNDRSAAAARDHLYMARGRFHHWPFRDWTDWNCPRDRGRAVALTTTTFQLSKVYGADTSFEYVRPVYLPMPGTVKVWRNGTPLVAGVGFTYLSSSSLNVNEVGVVTLASAIGGDTIETSFDFWCRCRYGIDRYDPRLVHRSSNGTLLIEWADIEIREVRPTQDS